MRREGLKDIIFKQKKSTSFPSCLETITKIYHVLNINKTLQLVINKNYVCHIF